MRAPKGCRNCLEVKTCELLKRRNYLTCPKRAYHKNYKNLKKVLGIDELVRLESKSKR